MKYSRHWITHSLSLGVLAATAVCASPNVRAGTLATYNFTGTVSELTGSGGLFPTGVAAGDPFDLQVVVDTSFPGTGGNGYEAYRQQSATAASPVESVSLELNGSAPITITSAFGSTTQGTGVQIAYNEVLSGNSLLDELVIGMSGRQSNGNAGSFSVSAIDQTFGSTPSGFTTSVQLGAPLGPTPVSAISEQYGDMPLYFQICANATCSAGSGMFGALTDITVSANVSSAPSPNSLWLLLGGLAIMGARLGSARRRMLA